MLLVKRRSAASIEGMKMTGWDRFTAQTVTEKLDRNLMSLSQAKRLYPDIKARTKKEFIREVWAANRRFADSLKTPE